MPVASPSSIDAAAPTPPMVALNLERPILADPRLTEVKRAIEQGEDDSALATFEAAVTHLDPAEPEAMQWHLWLGYAYQKRARCEAALGHFEAASGTAWPLRDYASLGLAQCHLALRHLDEVARILDAVHPVPPLDHDFRLLRAELYAQTGHNAEAAEIWREFLAAQAAPSAERTRVSLTLAEALVGSSGNHDAQRPLDLNDASDASLGEEPLKEALALLDAADPRDFDGPTYERFYSQKTTIIAKLFATDTSQKQQCTIRNQADELELFIENRDFKHALASARALVPELERDALLSTADGCRIQFSMARAYVALGQVSDGNATLEAITKLCSAPEDIVARSIYMVARRLQGKHELSQAMATFDALERRFPKHRLVDDARLRVAFAYLELGSEAKFTESIQRLVVDFPESDSAAEGLFQLALRAMTRSDWSTAASLLGQLGRLPKVANHEFTEQAERQIYFLARAHFQLGQQKLALADYEQLVRERPFSYYMLSAYSRIRESGAERARRLTMTSNADEGSPPFSVPYQPQFETPGFARALQLMALGEVERGVAELKALQLPKELEPLLLWARAAFEATAGSLKNSQRLVRERMRDWLRRWPAGAWEPAWKVAFPQPFLDVVTRESKRTQVPQTLIYAIMREESQFDRNAVSPADAYGLMQLIIPTAQSAARKLGVAANAATLVRPSVNIALGSEVLSKLLKRFDKLPVLAIPAYNAGPGRPKRWLKERPNMDFDVWVESIPFSETRTYVKHVLASWATYAWLYDRDHAEATMALPLRMPN